MEILEGVPWWAPSAAQAPLREMALLLVSAVLAEMAPKSLGKGAHLLIIWWGSKGLLKGLLGEVLWHAVGTISEMPLCQDLPLVACDVSSPSDSEAAALSNLPARQEDP